jgi:hypothetical protein
MGVPRSRTGQGRDREGGFVPSPRVLVCVPSDSDMARASMRDMLAGAVIRVVHDD